MLHTHRRHRLILTWEWKRVRDDFTVLAVVGDVGIEKKETYSILFSNPQTHKFWTFNAHSKVKRETRIISLTHKN
jgi:hypothetical protein